jgi:photosystem II stability/assembly factor-like uncharacterized protein
VKEPNRLSRTRKRGAPSSRKSRSRPKGKAKRRARPRSRVPGGKALARLNMFLRQRGVGTEPSPPPPPVLEAKGEQRRAAASSAQKFRRSSPAADLVEGFHLVRRELAAAAVTVPQAWQPLGPYFMPHGQTYGLGPGSRPPVAGRVSAVAVDPSDDQHILCGSGGGGVWETHDGGKTWTPRTDDQPSISIGAVAFDPSNPMRAYAGTGEGNNASSSTPNIRAAGLLVSDDGGSTWALMSGTAFVGVSFFDLAVDATDGNHILAATTNGLYETTDRGTTWARRRNMLTWSVSIHPSVSTNPMLAREVLAGCEDGLFRSKNGGKTWATVALPGLASGSEPNRLIACHAPSNGSIAYVFAAGPTQVVDPVALLESDEDPPAKMPRPHLWRRGSFGGAFTRITTPPDLQTGQAWYDWFAAVAPSNEDMLYVGAINAHRGIRQASGGWTWTNLSAKKPIGDCIHPDQHVITFSPTNPNVVYIGNDGGLFRSSDAGTSWESLNKVCPLLRSSSWPSIQSMTLG